MKRLMTPKMEAVTLWDFEATQPDELSFSKNSRICVINTDDSGWYKAVCGLHSGFVPATYIRMENNDWFRRMSRLEAEAFILQKDGSAFIHPDGAFIIRKCETDSSGFSLSVKHDNSVQHFKILTDSNNKFYIWPSDTFFSINQLVAAYRKINVSGDPSQLIILRDMQNQMYEAMYDFSPANEEEIPLRKGDKILLLSKSDENWWKGRANGVEGYFPRNYVKETY